MNRRKSIVLPSGPSSEKKYRSPFSFKRGDSSNMQIPEDPPERPDTAVTSQEGYGESARLPSESNERDVREQLPPSPPPQSRPDAVNGFAAQEGPPAETLTGMGASHVSRLWNASR